MNTLAEENLCLSSPLKQAVREDARPLDEANGCTYSQRIQASYQPAMSIPNASDLLEESKSESTETTESTEGSGTYSPPSPTGKDADKLRFVRKNLNLLNLLNLHRHLRRYPPSLLSLIEAVYLHPPMKVQMVQMVQNRMINLKV